MQQFKGISSIKLKWFKREFACVTCILAELSWGLRSSFCTLMQAWVLTVHCCCASCSGSVWTWAAGLLSPQLFAGGAQVAAQQGLGSHWYRQVLQSHHHCLISEPWRCETVTKSPDCVYSCSCQACDAPCLPNESGAQAKPPLPMWVQADNTHTWSQNAKSSVSEMILLAQCGHQRHLQITIKL